MADRQEQNQLLDAVEIIHHYYEDLFRPVASDFSLTPGQLRILHLLHRYGALSVGELALAAGMARTNMSSLCKKLSKAGFLLRRRGSGGDDRQVLLELTPEGEAAARRADGLLDTAPVALENADLAALSEKLLSVAHILSPQGEQIQKLGRERWKRLRAAANVLTNAKNALWGDKNKKELGHEADS